MILLKYKSCLLPCSKHFRLPITPRTKPKNLITEIYLPFQSIYILSIKCVQLHFNSCCASNLLRSLLPQGLALAILSPYKAFPRYILDSLPCFNQVSAQMSLPIETFLDYFPLTLIPYPAFFFSSQSIQLIMDIYYIFACLTAWYPPVL